jgi:hypothetical protein
MPIPGRDSVFTGAGMSPRRTAALVLALALTAAGTADTRDLSSRSGTPLVRFESAISTIADDSADGLSFCPFDSYVLIGGAGFLLGAAIGWLT